MQQQYADYNGDLYRNKHVEIHVDDGRSFVRRSRESYSSIQATLVDTWAASAAGAFTLSENNLYTAEAFADYLRRLKPNGVLSMTRWYGPSTREFLRLLGLGRAALTAIGVPESAHAAHFYVAADGRMATMLLSRSAYSPEDIELLNHECAQSRLRVVYSRGLPTADRVIRDFLLSNPSDYYAAQTSDLSPPTDNRPFFFYTQRPREFMTLLGTDQQADRNDLGLLILQIVLIISTALTLLLVVAPLVVFRREVLRTQRREKVALLVYFMMLGSGYILVELGLMQKFVLFLGHPVYALAVIVASLLVSSGIGSAISGRFATVHAANAIRIVAVVLCAVLVIYAFALGPVFDAALAQSIAIRIVLAAALVAMPGTLMGMLLPLGVRIATRFEGDVVPWAFGLNGATGVVGSTLAVALSMNWGFAATLTTGVAAYLAGAAVIGLAVTSRARQSTAAAVG
jgi:hypothetical protein